MRNSGRFALNCDLPPVFFSLFSYYIFTMKRTKGSKHVKRSLTAKKRGRKSSCTNEVIEETYRLCLLGLTNQQLADWFGKNGDTVEYWYRTNSEFKQAVDKGRKHADGKVAEALYLKAIGYRHQATKFFKDRVIEKEYDADGNVIATKEYTRIIKQPYIKQYPPDTKAAEKFLGSRNRETWGEAYKVEHKHAHMYAGETDILTLMDGLETYTDEELKVLARLGLTEKQQLISNGQ